MGLAKPIKSSRNKTCLDVELFVYCGNNGLHTYLYIYSTMNIILSILKAKVPVSSMLRSHERNGRFQQSCDWQQYGTEFRRNIYHVNKYWICQLGLPLIHIVRGTVEANVIVWMLQFSSPCCCGTTNSRSSINETWRWKVMNSPLLNCPVS